MILFWVLTLYAYAAYSLSMSKFLTKFANNINELSHVDK